MQCRTWCVLSGRSWHKVLLSERLRGSCFEVFGWNPVVDVVVVGGFVAATGAVV